MKLIVLSIIMTYVTVAHSAPLHLDLEMTSAEYQKFLKNNHQYNKLNQTESDPVIDYALKIGERLSQWIATINKNRSKENSIRLTSKETRRSFSIDKPNIYSSGTIKKETRTLLNQLPDEMKQVLLGQGTFPENIQLPDDVFIMFARKIDKNYQTAARYKAIDRYRSYYAKASYKDVRGYYYLIQKNITAEKLSDVTRIPTRELRPILEALENICINSIQNKSKCIKTAKLALTSNQLAPFYLKYINAAQAIWDEFFHIPLMARRDDVVWLGNVATVPFITPELPQFTSYLKNNIENEFQFMGWSLKLNFGNYQDAPYLIFRPGVVPSVDTLGGNEILMDSNQPIEEYESQWIIRHEFGHILGLPDCYHEFYDTELGVYVNYQLDTTDLMCSRTGNMNQRIYLELEKNYKN